jgi:hypothetical protein
MISKKHKKLIVDLIANDLIVNRLIYGLRALEVDASAYYPYLNELVFKLMGFKKRERNMDLYNCYVALSLKGIQGMVMVTDLATVRVQVERMYEELCGHLS